MNFYMAVGTVDWEQGGETLLRSLNEHKLGFEEQEDELEWDSDDATLCLRPGFAHEWILVGDAEDQQQLMQAVQQLSAALQALGIRHEFEIHAPDNSLIAEMKSG